ncbi:uncharacterized protein LOC117150575 isoform X2 [Drosophila mauritiana]|nr:uncharacterized protein LOC117150575 isoform X2 [Drosophila mauritiana]
MSAFIQFIQSLQTEKIRMPSKRMGEEIDVLLDRDSCTINGVDQEQPDAIHNDSNMEIFTEDDSRRYTYLQNCHFVGLCVLYNFCMLLIVVSIYIYKRWN